MMQEQVREAQVVTAVIVAAATVVVIVGASLVAAELPRRRPFERIRAQEIHLPAELAVTSERFRGNEIDPVEQREFHAVPLGPPHAGESQQQRPIARPQLQYSSGV